MSRHPPALAGDYRDAARDWVVRDLGNTPGVIGAFSHGSINWLADSQPVPLHSDLDIIVVHEAPLPALRQGKFRHGGVLLDVSLLAAEHVQTPEQILGVSHLAGSINAATVLLDPTGHLAATQRAVQARFANPVWVLRRCDHAATKILTFLGDISFADPFHVQVTSWLFATGVTTHVLLCAGLQNPTVRKRYVASRHLLADYGLSAFQEELLGLLGSRELDREQVQRHLDNLTQLFDVAISVPDPPFFFASDISDIARGIAIDGTQEMIDKGYHREAMFWIVATAARCQKILRHAKRDELLEHDATFREMLTDLGIRSTHDLFLRADETRAFLPKLWQIANTILEASPAIDET